MALCGVSTSLWQRLEPLLDASLAALPPLLIVSDRQALLVCVCVCVCVCVNVYVCVCVCTRAILASLCSHVQETLLVAVKANAHSVAESLDEKVPAVTHFSRRESSLA